MRLAFLLRPALPAGYHVLSPGAVQIGHDTLRSPDLVVVRADAVGPGLPVAPASAVALAVEVVSPGSRHQDRASKPVQYAAAGVEHYWRVEPDAGAL